MPAPVVSGVLDLKTTVPAVRFHPIWCAECFEFVAPLILSIRADVSTVDAFPTRSYGVRVCVEVVFTEHCDS